MSSDWSKSVISRVCGRAPASYQSVAMTVPTQSAAAAGQDRASLLATVATHRGRYHIHESFARCRYVAVVTGVRSGKVPIRR